ncbi:hypothetical protein [uncultured Chloroflexus sp.]|uniref:hypothetical protein n=1 Tax=uncultured Chloroflexus sp. TaxID=214040 RepID=UPI0026276D23|nr:hypothetical protein [uncultured Chloroflexus sp.]
MKRRRRLLGGPGQRRLPSRKAWIETLCVTGVVRSLEITHGAHGWHPHLHNLTLLPYRRRVSYRDLWRDLWIDALRLCGADGLAGVAYHERIATTPADAAEYIAKSLSLRVSLEAASAVSKRGRRGSRNQWQILADSCGDRASRDAALWYEYVAAVRGRSSLQYSRGLRSRLTALSDGEVAAAETDQLAVILASLGWSQWRRVLENNARSDLLRVAESGDAAQVAAFLASLGVDAGNQCMYTYL